MSLSVFTGLAQAYPLDQDGFEKRPERDVLIVRLGRGLYEQRAARGSRRFHTYRVGFNATKAQADAIDTFFVALSDEVTSFLWQDPEGYSVTGVPLGTASGSTSVFSLPLTGGYGGEYPANVGGTLLYDDGVSIARTVQTDARTLTATGGNPGAGSVMTADLVYFRRVRLESAYSWRRIGGGAVYATEMTWREVPA